MSKRSELLGLLSGYVDGLARGDIIKRLPEAWFVTNEHGKEVQNALDGLRRQGLVDRVEVGGAGSGVFNWAVVSAEKAPKPEMESPETWEDTTNALGDPCCAHSLASPAVEFRETPPPAERFEIGAVATLPEGVEEVRRYRVVEDGTDWETPEVAAMHRAKVLRFRLIEAFVAGWAPQDMTERVGDLMVRAIEAWEDAKGRAA